MLAKGDGVKVREWARWSKGVIEKAKGGWLVRGCRRRREIRKEEVGSRRKRYTKKRGRRRRPRCVNRRVSRRRIGMS